MARAGPPTAIAELRRLLERAETPAGTWEVLPFGVTEIDAYLPGSGLTQGALHEVIDGGSAETCAAVATLFIGGIPARLSAPVLWCCRGRDLFAPALVALRRVNVTEREIAALKPSLTVILGSLHKCQWTEQLCVHVGIMRQSCGTEFSGSDRNGWEENL
jgi:hypothetical protein